MLKIREISVGYGVCEVISGANFEVSNGEILAIAGANGAGKTTLLKSLNGTKDTLKGEILIDEKNLSDFSRRELAKKIAVVAQEAEMKFPVTVLEFVLGGRFAHGNAFGWETENDLDLARKALQECDLAGFETRLMNQLSGGERQRVVLARALATEAKILLLDEPTANLDLQHQVSILQLVRKKCDENGVSAVIITHDLNLAAEFADKIILLKHGKIVANGEPKKVLTSENLKKVFETEVLVDAHPLSGKPRITMSYRQ